MSAHGPETSPFLTDRALQTAQAAGAIAIEANPSAIFGTYFMLADRLPYVTVPDNLEALRFVMRWGGTGNRLPWEQDTKYDYAPAETNYWPYEFDTSTARNRGRAVNKAAIVESGRKVIEITVRSWKRPRLGRWLARGIVDYATGARTAGSAVGDMLTGFNELPAHQEAIHAVQERYPRPFGVTLLL